MFNATHEEMQMREFKYFSGITELKNIHSMKNAQFAAMFPTVKGRRMDGFSMLVGHPVAGRDEIMPVERIIDYKANPSLHACNAKCMSGKVNGACECSCGGKNHGLSSVFSHILKAA